MNEFKELIFFPGCTLTTTAKENYYSLFLVCKKLGFKLVELKDWNCCGTSSAHSLNPDLALDLALRNISLAEKINTLLVACPTCFIRLKYAHLLVKKDHKLRQRFKMLFKRDFPENLKIVPILEFIERHINTLKHKKVKDLNKLRFLPYYGCMLNYPPIFEKREKPVNTMESLLKELGGDPLFWGYKSLCCGTFLSIVKPEAVTKIINKIFLAAIDMGAECIVTACSMCHLNLELRCKTKQKIPIFHFSELIAIALGESIHINWFKRHLINPIPLLKQKGLIQ